jgi:hypothetical protein
MKKVIIDTNLWISFLIGHQTQFVRRLLTDLRLSVFVCPELINEIRDVASRDKISSRVTPSEVEDLMAIIYAFCQQATIISKTPDSAIRDPKDLYLLSLAETIDADYIVSGDADLTDLEVYRQTRIVKLVDFKQMMGY